MKAAIASGICVDADNNNIARAAPRKSDPGAGSGRNLLTRNFSFIYVRIFVSDPVLFPLHGYKVTFTSKYLINSFVI